MTESDQAGAIPDVLGPLPMSDLMSDPYGTLARIRESSPAVAVKSAGYRVWVITRYEDVRKVMGDSNVIRDFVRYGREIRERCLVGEDRVAHVPNRTRRSFRERDGAEHHRLRTLIGHLFAPGNLAELSLRVSALCQELLDSMTPGQPIELMDRFCRPLAGRAVCALTGLPDDDLITLSRLENDMQTSPVIEEVERCAEALAEWARAVVAAKRREPADDLCTHLLTLQDESIMTEDEVSSTYIVLMVNGMQSAAALGNGLFTFLNHPDQLAKALADPRLFATGVDELVRYESPVRIVPTRYTTAPVDLGEVTIPAGELVYLSLAAGNRDPRRFTDADVFDVTRVPGGHLGFGHGVHRCVGAQFGKMTMGTALEMFFSRFPAAELAEPPTTAWWRPGKFLRRLDTLSVVPR